MFTVITMKFLYTNLELNLAHHLNYVVYRNFIVTTVTESFKSIHV